jgi:hypothetical protein
MEKLDLFFGIMVALILALIPAALLLRDQLERRRKTGKRVKALKMVYNSVYWLAVVLFVLVAGREVLGYIAKRKAATQQSTFEKADTSMLSRHDRKTDTGFTKVDTKLDNLSSKVDTGFDKLHHSGTPDYKPMPAVLEVCANNQITGLINPLIEPIGGPDSFRIRMVVCNRSAGTAINLKDVAVSVVDNGGNIFIAGGIFPPAFNKHTKIPPNEAVPMSTPLGKGGGSAPTYFCFKLTYSDSTKRKDSIVEIYNMYPMDKIVNKDLVRPNSSVFVVIEKMLMDRGIW